MLFRKNPTTSQIIKLDKFGNEFSEWLVPSSEEIVNEEKRSKIFQAKSKAAQLIVAQYPDYKQRNILMSGDELAIADMNAFIEPIRIRSNEIESDLNDCTTIEELNNVNTDF